MPHAGRGRVAFVGLLVGVLTLSACGGGGQQAGGGGDDGSPLIVATTTHLADFARVVGGDDAEVYQVLRPGISPHEHEPTPADLDAVAGAQVVIHNGLDLETFWDDLVEAGDPQGIVVDASDGVEVLGSDEEEADPHIWHDPIRAKTMVANLTEALAQADPEQAQGYRDRASAYVVELNRLDADIARQLSALPSDKIVTNHDAFGYYVDRYGLDFVGAIIPSFDSTAELSVDDVQRIVALIQAEDVRAVFSESDLPPKTAEAIGREAGVAVVAGEDALYGDSFGPPGSGAETYLDMMRHNTEVIVEHLA